MELVDRIDPAYESMIFIHRTTPRPETQVRSMAGDFPVEDFTRQTIAVGLSNGGDPIVVRSKKLQNSTTMKKPSVSLKIIWIPG